MKRARRCLTRDHISFGTLAGLEPPRIYGSEECPPYRFASNAMAVALALAFCGNAVSQVAGPTAPTPAKVPNVPDAVVTAYATVGVDFVVGTIKYVHDAQTPLVDRATAETIGSANTRLLEGYHASMRDARYGASQFHSFMSLAITTGTVSAASSGVAAPVAIPVGIVASKLNDMGRDYLIANAQARASAAMSEGLSTMTAQQRTMMDSLLKAGKYQQAADHFDKTTGVLSSMRTVLKDDASATDLLNKSLDAAMAQGSVAAIRTSAAAVSKVDSLQADFIRYTRKFSEFGKRTDASLEKLKTATESLKTQLDGVQGGLADLSTKQKANAVQLAIIQDVLFDQQPPSVKLAMLNAGAKQGLTLEQTARLKAILTIQVKQQEISVTATTIVNYARDLRTIMGAFGVNDPGLDRAINYGNTAATALTQAFSGNYLGAVASVAGLFGGGTAPPDPMAEHMKTIMAAFTGVNQRLDEVLKLQVQTLEAIDRLARDISAVRREMNSRFDRVDFELATLRGGQQRLIWAPLDVCENAFLNQDADVDGNKLAPEGLGRYDKASRRFRSFDSLFEYTNSHGDKAYACADYLEGVFATFRNPNALGGNPLSLSFAESKLGIHAGVPDAPPVQKSMVGNIEVVEYDLPALAYFKGRLYEPSLRLLRAGWAREYAANPGWGGLANAYALLTRPSASAGILLERMSALGTTTAADPSSPCQGNRSLLGRRLQDYMCTNSSTYNEPIGDAPALVAAEGLAALKAEGFLGVPILRDQVGQLMEYAMFVASPRDLAKSRQSPEAYTLKELAANKRDPYGRNLLTRALTVVDVSIAQQAMLYGDMTAYFVFRQLWDPTAKNFRTSPMTAADASAFNDAKLLLANPNNPWLQRNVLMLILKTSERGCVDVFKGKRCTANELLFRLGMSHFFNSDESGKYLPTSQNTLRVAEATLRSIFDVDPSVRFVIRDVVPEGDAPGSVPRTVFFELGGFQLPMPTHVTWGQGLLVYPPFMHDRLMDRERVGNRLASYAALDGMTLEAKKALFVLLANEQRR